MTSGPDFPDPAECVGMTVLLRPRDLNTYHRNPRRGDVEAIMGSLRANGQFKPIVVNVGSMTGRPNEVLAGNHTLLAFRRLAENNPFEAHWTGIKADVIDVDDEEAARIVLVDNQSWELGEGTDDAAVAELLNVVGTTGTGYSDEEMDALLEKLNPTVVDPPDADPEPPSLPEREPSAIGFTINFDDEDQISLWYEFVKTLRSRYPDLETVAECLLAHLADTESERV